MDEKTGTSQATSNVELVRRALTDLDALPELLAEDLTMHFHGSVPGIEPVHHGRDNVFVNFWGKLIEATDGHFAVEPVDVWAAGDELVVAHVKVTVDAHGPPLDAVEVYRIRDGRIADLFDVPATPPT